jgi:glycosyltransferase involved in cell wall biosynthesis
MPISGDDYISPSRLQNKLDGVGQSKPLKLCYIGRAIDMKGPMDWLNAVHELIKSGVGVTAKWLGDGSLLEKMRATVENLGLNKYVAFPGYVSDRKEVLQTLQDSDVFLFCHKTPESPRCLVEALASGCPLVGYAGAYPQELVARYGGGGFATTGDWKGLASIVQDLDTNREKLRELVRSASISGRIYERDATMQNRIDLIDKYLKPVTPLG